MGRKKIAIQEILNPTKRREKFKKRLPGFYKKLYELSELCDLDVCAMVESPSGELSLFCKDKQPEDVITAAVMSYSITNSYAVLDAAYKLNCEQGLEVSMVEYYKLQLQNERLREENLMLEKEQLTEEILDLEQKGKLSGGSEDIKSITSINQRKTLIKGVEEALSKAHENILAILEKVARLDPRGEPSVGSIDPTLWSFDGPSVGSIDPTLWSFNGPTV